MSEAHDANKERNREIAHNEEAKQIAGSVRISAWAISLAVAIAALLFAIGWIASRQ
jgi:hypothetical protein